MKKIFLHIGMDKTGTTAIQSFFNKNRALLKTKGLLYPETGENRVAHYELSGSLGFFHGKKNIFPDPSTLSEKIATEISEFETIIFSSEFFMIPANIQPVKHFFSDYDTKIIIYLRRHDTWWESVYNQAVKTVVLPPWGRGFENYMNFQNRKHSKRGKYRNLVDMWANSFGKENIIVRPYEKQQNEPNIIFDFLKTIGFDSIMNEVDIISERTNESLSYLALNLIDIYQRANIDNDIRSHLIQKALFLKDISPYSSIVSPSLRKKLVDQNLPDYEYIAKEYLGRTDGKLFYDTMPNENDPWISPNHPTWANVVEYTVQYMMDHRSQMI
jgi:hypothetical protein